MKRILIFMLSCVSAAAIIGCEKQIESEPPVLSSDAKDIHVTAEGGTQTITYNIENPAEDGMITASPDSECDWIEITDTETSGVITFNVLKNETDAKRESKITVTYEYSGGDPQSFSVNVSQDSGENNPDPDPDPDPDPNPGEDVFTITVDNITYSTANIRVVPDDETMPYIVYVDIASEIKDLSDDEVFQMDYDIILGNANASQITINEYLNTIVKHGPQETTQKSLDPGTEYAVWAYRIDLQEDGTLVRLSKITREYFTTEIPTVTENSITLEVESTGTTLSAVATPYTNDKYYNLNWNNESTLVNAGYTDGTVAERCFQFEYDYMTMYMGFYPVTAWANVKQGPATTSTVMTKPGTYYLFAYFINDDATADGEIILKTIEFDGSNVTIR